MLIAFICASIFFGLVISYAWSSRGILNVSIKALCTLYTLWAVVMLLVQLAPMINTGTLRLI
jgi:hypothetical protein